MNAQAIIVLLAAMMLVACASSSDPWREAARGSVDTGSAAWWDKTKRGF